eukprot:PhM_4_TR350/c0_g1_i1/m.71515
MQNSLLFLQEILQVNIMDALSFMQRLAAFYSEGPLADEIEEALENVPSLLAEGEGCANKSTDEFSHELHMHYQKFCAVLERNLQRFRTAESIGSEAEFQTLCEEALKVSAGGGGDDGSTNVAGLLDAIVGSSTFDSFVELVRSYQSEDEGSDVEEDE